MVCVSHDTPWHHGPRMAHYDLMLLMAPYVLLLPLMFYDDPLASWASLPHDQIAPNVLRCPLKPHEPLVSWFHGPLLNHNPHGLMTSLPQHQIALLPWLLMDSWDHWTIDSPIVSWGQSDHGMTVDSNWPRSTFRHRSTTKNEPINIYTIISCEKKSGQFVLLYLN